MITGMEGIEVTNYCSTLLAKMHSFQLANSFCDVKLSALDGYIPVHRLLLIAASPYFTKALTASDCSGERKSILTLNHIPLKYLEKVVRFMYTGRLEVYKEEVEQVKNVCKELELDLAAKACTDLIQKGFTVYGTNGIQSQTNFEEKNDVKEDSLIIGDISDIESSEKTCTKCLTGIAQDHFKVKNKRVVSLKKKPKLTSVKVKILANKLSQRKTVKRKHKNKPSTGSDTGDVEIISSKYKGSEDVNENMAPSNGDKNLSEVVNDLTKLTNSENTHTEDRKVNVVIKTELDEVVEDKTNEKDSNTLRSGPRIKKMKICLNKIPMQRGKKIGLKIKKETSGSDTLKFPKDKKKRKKKEFPCGVCPKILTSYKRKMFHEFSKHGMPFDEKYNKYMCKEEGCTYVAANRHNLDMHMKSRHGKDRPHICEFCGKGFKLPNILATHLNIHTGLKLWKCDTCGENFNQQSGLDVHIKRHHMGESSWAELCHLCSEKFLQKADLAWHLFKVHDQPLPDKYKVYICETCNYLTKSYQDFQRHKNAHKGWKKHVCDICGFKTIKFHHYQRHRERHDGIKQFNCPVCQKACSTKSELKRHVSFHGEKKYKCTFEGCTYACTDSIGLTKHIKLMHTHRDYKPYACPVCQYRTGVKGNADKHIRTVHDFIVVTKHTVHLKMKYQDFESGDVITKDGQLVATAKDRKALQQGHNEKNFMMSMETDMDSNADDLSATTQDKLENSGENLTKKRSRKIKTFVGHHSSFGHMPTGQLEIPTVVDTQAMDSDLDSAQGLNYVYIHGDTLLAHMNAAMMPQDLRLSVSNSSAIPSDTYTTSSGSLFMSD